MERINLIAGFTFLALGLAGIGGQLAYAIHHDCTPKPPLASTAFGHPVPIDAICRALRY